MNNIKSYMTRAAALSGLLLGAFVISAFAAWTTAPANPPQGNVAAPINVSATAQYKQGPLGINTTSLTSGELFKVFGVGTITDFFAGKVTTTNLQVIGGTPATGKVLTAADADGNVNWQLPSGGNQITFDTLFYRRRSAEFSKDAISWCPAEYPKLVNCSTVEENAPPGIADFGTWCPNDGLCDTSNAQTVVARRRPDPGDDDLNFETVISYKTSPATQGCLAYDYGHNRRAYKIDLLCAK